MLKFAEVMLFKTAIVLYSFIVLVRTRECQPGQDCLLRCCRTTNGDLVCRERCLGLPCDNDVHCDGDCCVNSTCSSCLLKSLPSTGSSPVRISTQLNPENLSTKKVQTTDKEKLLTETKKIDQEDRLEVTRSSSSTKRVNMNECSRFNNKCPSNCCIDGQCVDHSLCVPVKAARGGRGGGGRGVGGRGRGRSFRGSRSGGRNSGGSSGRGSLPVWGIVLAIVGSVFSA